MVMIRIIFLFYENKNRPKHEKNRIVQKFRLNVFPASLLF